MELIDSIQEPRNIVTAHAQPAARVFLPFDGLSPRPANRAGSSAPEAVTGRVPRPRSERTSGATRLVVPKSDFFFPQIDENVWTEGLASLRGWDVLRRWGAEMHLSTL